jgi:hypothetical protein
MPQSPAAQPATRLTRSCHRPSRNPAAQQSPAAAAVCCRLHREHGGMPMSPVIRGGTIVFISQVVLDTIDPTREFMLPVPWPNLAAILLAAARRRRPLALLSRCHTI